MPFITRQDADKAYNSFVYNGLPKEGTYFEEELVKMLFEEMRGEEKWSLMFLGTAEYLSYRFCADLAK